MADSIRVLEQTLKALANRRRLAIIKFLQKRKEANVGDIAEHIGLSFRSTSRHLRTLVAVDILEFRQEDLYVYYRINPRLPKNMSDIIAVL